MLSLLASLKEFPEETATKLLSNDLLIGRLRTVNDDKKFQEIVESAIADENALLLEEKAALAKQIERERVEKEAKEKRLEEKLIMYKQEKIKAEQAQLTLRQKEIELESLEKLKNKEKERAERATKEVEKERMAKEDAEKQTTEGVSNIRKAEKTITVYAVIAASAISIIFITIFEILAYWLPWNWLRNHPSSYSLQGSFDVLIILAIFGFFRPKWRKWCWGSSGLFVVIILILSLLGGPTPTSGSKN
jgi:hypothetical protein